MQGFFFSKEVSNRYSYKASYCSKIIVAKEKSSFIQSSFII